jgi:hypothetical protein
MNQTEIDQNKATFLEYAGRIKRPGFDKLMKWLETTDFFTAPASTKYHSSEPGGLCKHSLNVLKCFCSADFKQESVLIVCLLHDLCKTNYYTVSTRNVKNEETGAWEKQPFYLVDDQLPYGHGEKSVFIIERCARLTTEEAFAIRFHMGGFDDASKNCMAVFAKFPLALELHIADLRATYQESKIIKEEK